MFASAALQLHPTRKWDQLWIWVAPLPDPKQGLSQLFAGLIAHLWKAMPWRVLLPPCAALPLIARGPGRIWPWGLSGESKPYCIQQQGQWGVPGVVAAVSFSTFISIFARARGGRRVGFGDLQN